MKIKKLKIGESIIVGDFHPRFMPDHRFAPPHAIWFQTQDKLKAFVSVVNNQYRYEIYNRITGKQIEEGYYASLAAAKAEVLKYFKKHDMLQVSSAVQYWLPTNLEKSYPEMVKALETFRDVQLKYEDFGSTDSEPEGLVQHIIASALEIAARPISPKNLKPTAWELYESEKGWEVAAEALTKAAIIAFDKIKKFNLSNDEKQSAIDSGNFDKVNLLFYLD